MCEYTDAVARNIAAADQIAAYLESKDLWDVVEIYNCFGQERLRMESETAEAAITVAMAYLSEIISRKSKLEG